MKVTVTAKDSFAHGAKTYLAGDKVELSVYDARELAKAGLTSEPEDSDKAIETPRLQDVKMTEAPENKMADAPANKSRAKKAE